MTRQHNLKRAARELAASAGISYTAARRQLLHRTPTVPVRLGHTGHLPDNPSRATPADVVLDLAAPLSQNRAPVVLVTGAPGSGWSVAVRNLINGYLTATSGPRDDPSVVLAGLLPLDFDLDDSRVQSRLSSAPGHLLDTLAEDRARNTPPLLVVGPERASGLLLGQVHDVIRGARSAGILVVVVTTSAAAAKAYSPLASTLVVLRQFGAPDIVAASEMLRHPTTGANQVEAEHIKHATTGRGWIRSSALIPDRGCSQTLNSSDSAQPLTLRSPQR